MEGYNRKGKKNLYNVYAGPTRVDQVHSRKKGEKIALKQVKRGKMQSKPKYKVKYTKTIGDPAHGGSRKKKSVEVYAKTDSEARKKGKKKIEQKEGVNYNSITGVESLGREGSYY